MFATANTTGNPMLTTGTATGSVVTKSTVTVTSINEKSWNIAAFCQQVSKLMVSEIRQRASNQSTEAASIAIVKFLEFDNSANKSSSGWLLLTTLNILANGDNNLIQVSDEQEALLINLYLILYGIVLYINI